MADRQRAKPANSRTRNPERRNGKAWKGGKSPAVREEQARIKRLAKSMRTKEEH